MDQEIIKLQLEADLKELIKDIKAGLYDGNQEEFEKARDRILEKVKKNNLEFWAMLKWLQLKKEMNLLD